MNDIQLKLLGGSQETISHRRLDMERSVFMQHVGDRWLFDFEQARNLHAFGFAIRR